jgi:hypothetical protein
LTNLHFVLREKDVMPLLEQMKEALAKINDMQENQDE